MDSLKIEIEKRREAFEEALARVKNQKSLVELRNEYLSRQRGIITGYLDELKKAKPQEKPEIGRLINDFKKYVQEKVQNLQASFSAPKQSLEKIDLTLPGESLYVGSPHPILLFQQEIENILQF
jgi:phenylalanyl-tRNA synthetase alpha chain